MKPFRREIGIYKSYFTDFYNEQSVEVRKKIDWTVLLIESLPIVPERYFKHLTHTSGLWEIRIAAGKGIYRIFCFFDKEQLVVLLGGFQKKTQKTPKREIKKAERLKKEYFENKRF